MERRDQRLLQPREPVLTGQVQEDLLEVASQRLVGGQIAQVGVELGRAGVVVAGRDLGIAAQAALLAPCYQQHLGMGLEPDDAVDHLRADRFEQLGVVDVGLLVEARLELDHGRDLLAAAHRLAQQLGHLALAAGAVDGLLDRQHVRVLDRLAQEGQHGVEALIGLVDQHIALLQPVEEGLARRQLDRPARLVARKAQLGRIDQVDQLGHAHQVDRAGHLVERLGRQVELLQQEVRQEVRAAGRDLEPQRAAVMAVLQAHAQRGAQVLDLLLVDREVGVAGDAELRELGHLAAREQVAQVGPDHARDRDEMHLARALDARHAQEARQRPGHLDDRDLVLAAKGIAP